MERRKIFALVLIGCLAALLILNRSLWDGMSLDLWVTRIQAAKSLVLLAAVSLGVLIGVLLK